VVAGLSHHDHVERAAGPQHRHRHEDGHQIRNDAQRDLKAVARAIDEHS
jgi:hypothetical protein